MKVFLSVFKSEKCASCNKAFQITMKRRMCRKCRNLQLEKLFCTECSVKRKAPELGFFRHKRYCIQCYNIEEQRYRATVRVEKSPDNLDTKYEKHKSFASYKGNYYKVHEDFSYNSSIPEHNQKHTIEDHNSEEEKCNTKEKLSNNSNEEEEKKQIKKNNFLIGLRSRLSRIIVKNI